MKKWILILVVFATTNLLACQSANQTKENEDVENTEVKEQLEGKLSEAYFASGCFWCVEAIFESVRGVKEAISGYSGGKIENPTYEQVSRASTQHAEAVKVLYDPNQVDFETLVRVFFGSHDPTTANRQGPDRGPQYRSIAFYSNENEMIIINKVKEELEKNEVFPAPIVTEVTKFEKFWDAEDYHQDYEKRNPNVPYVRAVSIPRLNRFKEKFPELLKSGH